MGASEERGYEGRCHPPYCWHTVGAHICPPNECRTLLWTSSGRRETELGEPQKGGLEVEERGGGARRVALPESGFAVPCLRHPVGCWVLGARQRSPWEKKGAPSPFSGMCAAPSPAPGGPGATWSAILMLSAGPGCCKHPYATLLQGLRVANNHGHLLAWHRARAQRPGNRARQRLVLRRAP